MSAGELRAGDPAPDFRVRRLDGGHVVFSEWFGRRLLLIFIQPHCNLSRAILGALAGMSGEVTPAGAFPVLISCGRVRDNEPLRYAYGIRFPWLLQDDTEVAARYGLPGTPASCLVDESGRLVGLPNVGVAGVMEHLGLTPLPFLMPPHRDPGGMAPTEGGTTPYIPINERLHALLAAFERLDPWGATVQSTDNPGTTLTDQSPGQQVPVAETGPLVTVIMTTRDRPSLLPIALECYRRQTYQPRELLVIDDGTRWQADPEAVAAVGGRIIPVEEGTTLGTKLNRGCEEARGALCQKWDDDDWYAPRFLETLVGAHQRRIDLAGGSAIAYLTLPLLFDLPRWRLLPWTDDDPCGATLLFEREVWETSPFEDIRTWDDFWFLVSHFQKGVAPVSVRCDDLYAILRHDTLDVGNGHSWGTWAGNEPMNSYLQRWRGEVRDPATLLPLWARDLYQSVLHGAGASSEAEHGTAPMIPLRTQSPGAIVRADGGALRPMAKPHPDLPRDLVIAATARCGSSWLCDLLEQNGLGHGTEHFHPEIQTGTFAPALTTELSTEAFVQRLRGEEDSDIFVTKIMSEWFTIMRAHMRQYCAGDAEMLRTLFPRAAYVHITRRDILGAAISLLRARLTGEWERLEDAPAHDAPRGAITSTHIHDAVIELKQWQLLWRDAFAHLGVTPLEVTYEELAADPAGVVRRIAAHLGRPLHGNVVTDSPFLRQASAQSAAMRREYERSIREAEDQQKRR